MTRVELSNFTHEVRITLWQNAHMYSLSSHASPRMNGCIYSLLYLDNVIETVIPFPSMYCLINTQEGYKKREDRITELEEFIDDQVVELDKMEAAMKQTVANKDFAEKELNVRMHMLLCL